MKKLLFILLTMAFVNTQAQNYVPFDFENSEWYMSEQIEHHDIGGPFFFYYDYKIAYSGEDDTLNNVVYKKLGYYRVWASSPASQSSNGQYYYFREEDKKIYITHVSHYSLDTVPEYLLYDFNMHVGDSIELPDLYPYNDIPGLKLQVFAEDSVNTPAGYRRRLQLKYICSFVNNPSTYSFMGDSTIDWIEGIGSDQGLVYNVQQEQTQGFETFVYAQYLCFQYNDTIYQGDECYYYTLIGLNENAINNLRVYPNPTVSAFTINTDLKGKIAIELFNATGQLVLFETYQALPQKQVDVASLPNGMYYLRLQNNGQYYSQKVVISK